MTPAQLDILLNGAFVYQRSDGTEYASFDYAMQKLGVRCLRRTGPLSAEDLRRTPDQVLARLNQELAAA